MADNLFSQLEEALRTEAVAAMAAYENGIYQTQHKLDGCLEELQTVQAAAEQQCQLKVQQLQEEYQQQLEQLTLEYEHQVRLLEEVTKKRVTEVHVEMEEIVTQAAAELLYTMQQQQQAAYVMPPTSSLQPDDPQLAATSCTLPDQQQYHASTHHDQLKEPQQQPWQLDLEQHKQSWQQLEQEELMLHQQHDRDSRYNTPYHSVTDPVTLSPEAAAQTGKQQQKHSEVAVSSRSHTLCGQTPFLSSSAPASVSASRQCSRNMSCGPAEAGRNQQPAYIAHGSRKQEVQQPPTQLLRALSAVDVLKRAQSSRQQVHQGWLKGLRRVSTLSSADGKQAVDSSRGERNLPVRASFNRSKSTSASMRGSSWQDMLAYSSPTAADTARSCSKQDAQRAVLVAGDAGQLHLCQGRGDKAQCISSKRQASTKLPVRNSGGTAVFSSSKVTQALDLLNDDSE